MKMSACILIALAVCQQQELSVRGRREIAQMVRELSRLFIVIGLRPFDVLLSPDEREVYTIDHDSYSLTAVDTGSLSPRQIGVLPLGRGAYDKPHYGAVDAHGHIWLPIQGKVMVDLDPGSGRATSTALSADTHQHDITFTPDGHPLLILGSGPAGGAVQGPSLTIFDTDSGLDEV